MLPAAARHGPAAIATADYKSRFEDGGKDNDAFCFVNQVRRNIVGDVHHFLDDRPAIFQPLGFLLVFRGGKRQGDKGQGHKTRQHLLDHNSPRRSFLSVNIIECPRAGCNLGPWNWFDARVRFQR